VCRFEFPERPGALMQFLDSARRPMVWEHHLSNTASAPISGACRRVRGGPAHDSASFEEFLVGLGIRYQLEESNDAYRRFLGS